MSWSMVSLTLAGPGPQGPSEDRLKTKKVPVRIGTGTARTGLNRSA